MDPERHDGSQGASPTGRKDATTPEPGPPRGTADDRRGAPDHGGLGSGPRRSWRGTLTRWTHRMESRLDRVRHRLKKPFLTDPILIEPYLGYGDASRVRVRARVLEDRGLGPSAHDDTLLTNLRNSWRRFESDEVPGARVRVAPIPAAADAAAPSVEVVADDEGFIEAELPLPDGFVAAAATEGTVGVAFELLSPRPSGQEGTRFLGEAVVVGRDVPYGVVSDVDDTVLLTGATRLRAVLTRTLLQNASDRLPFPGASALYRAFEAAGAPLFYVSSSPWNLYAVLAEFLDLNDLPLGPLLLRDWGITAMELLPLGHGTHKREAIDGVLNTYPDLPFVLVGDSGQEDPEIYADVVRRHPGRVLGVVIRHVGDDARAAAVRELVRTLADRDVPLYLVSDSAQAARHAEAHGWIDAAGRAATERETEAARAAPPPT